jgi:hypothetical protein
MDAGSRSDEQPSRVGQYDFDRLEQSVEFLINEHERLSGEREALLGELLDREHRSSTLERRLDAEQSKRRVAVEGVDKILARLEQLQASVTAAAKAAS